VSTGSAVSAGERVGLPWICSEHRAPKAETKPLTRYTRHVGETYDPESLLQSPLGGPFPADKVTPGS
jgi:hypothetical protein